MWFRPRPMSIGAEGEGKTTPSGPKSTPGIGWRHTLGQPGDTVLQFRPSWSSWRAESNKRTPRIDRPTRSRLKCMRELFGMRSRRSLLSVAAALIAAVLAGMTPVSGQEGGVDRQGIFNVLPLTPGSTDILLSKDGRLAVVASVTFNRERSEPERVLLLAEPGTRRVLWRRSLPSPHCCAFPAVAMSQGAETVVLGGAERTLVFGQDGAQVFAATLADGRLHSTVAVADDGQGPVVGEWEGRIAAFDRGASAPLWVRDVDGNLMGIALAGNGEVLAAALRGQWLLLRARDGAELARRAYGPARIAAVAISRIGSRAAVVWKREDGRMVVEASERGRTAWVRDLGQGTVPLLQLDDSGRWLAVGDLLGLQAVVLSFDGRVLWKATGPPRTTAAVDREGVRAVVGQGSHVAVRSLPDGRMIWQSRMPGVPHLLRLAGPRLAVLGTPDPAAGVPDRIWFAQLGSP